jgi:hypothetical protein
VRTPPSDARRSRPGKPWVGTLVQPHTQHPRRTARRLVVQLQPVVAENPLRQVLRGTV